VLINFILSYFTLDHTIYMNLMTEHQILSYNLDFRYSLFYLNKVPFMNLTGKQTVGQGVFLWFLFTAC